MTSLKLRLWDKSRKIMYISPDEIEHLMRLKLRAWLEDYGVMVRVGAIILNSGVFLDPGVPHIMDQHNDIYLLSEVELMQSTGLFDKNGVEIYGGDVLCYREGELYNWNVGQVRWMGEGGYPAFDVYPYIDCDSNGLSYIMACCECEVIGNVYENPELLK